MSKTATPMTDAFVFGEGRQSVPIASLCAASLDSPDVGTSDVNLQRLRDGLGTYPEGLLPVVIRFGEGFTILYFTPAALVAEYA